jgi:hypothetical protein
MILLGAGGMLRIVGGVQNRISILNHAPDVKAFLAANQLGRRNLTPSQKGVLALEIEKQLAEAAKLRRRATQINTAGKAVVAKFPQQEQGKARDKAAEMVGANPHYVSDAKQIEQDAPEIPDHVKQGKLSIPQAKRVAALAIYSVGSRSIALLVITADGHLRVSVLAFLLPRRGRRGKEAPCAVPAVTLKIRKG